MISINFATRNYRRIQQLQRVLIVFILALFVIAGAVVWSTLSLRSGIAAIDERIKELETDQEQFKPILAEREQVIRDLSAMSALMESRTFSWTRLFTRIEHAFPVGVAVAKVEYNRRERMLALEGAAHSPESLTNLMVAFERSHFFKDPYLKHQSVDKGSISFNVVAIYNEHQAAAAGMAARK